MHSVQTITPAAQQDSLSSRASKHASQEYHRLWSWYPEYLVRPENERHCWKMDGVIGERWISCAVS